MHRRSQFDMRENPASDRRHGSRSALQEDSSPDTSRLSHRQETTLVASDGTELENSTTKGFATGEGREDSGTSTTLSISVGAPDNTRTKSGTNHHAGRQPHHIVNDVEFEPLLDVAEAARLLRIHPKTLRVKAGNGIIPGIQIGRAWRFRASMLNRWLEGNTRRG
jgi:excisionase family DNA binding protein